MRETQKNLIEFLKGHSFEDAVHDEAVVEERRVFLETFPIDIWLTLEPEDYALDKSTPSLCWALKFSTKELGGMSVGNQKQALIYRRKDTGELYFPSDYDSLEQAWEIIRGSFIHLFEMAKLGDWEAASSIEEIYEAHAIRAKLLSIYFPDDILPIHSKGHLVSFLKELNVPSKEFGYGQDIVILNRKLLDILRNRGFDQTPMQLGHAIYEWRKSQVSEDIVEHDENIEELTGNRIVIADYPLSYDHVRRFLSVTEGEPFASFGELGKQISEMSGTAKAPRDWSEPDLWINDLTGLAQKLATQIWQGSENIVTPRYPYRGLMFVRRYGLVEGKRVELSEKGKQFMQASAELEREIDDKEGLLFILRLFGGRELGRTELYPYWAAYVEEVQASDWSQRTKYGFLRQRLNNLSARKLLQRKGNRFRLTPAGLDWIGTSVPPIVVPPIVVNSVIKAALEYKKQVVLYGPPGTGKTFAARKFGAAWLKSENKTQHDFTLVTFHASYTYEDFVEGLRPDPHATDLRLNLVPGLFKRMCTTAREQPTEKFLLIIDEINRANVAKVFGELLTLLEKDKRLTSVVLPQSQQAFSVPKNLYIIGTMNTADRSLKHLDAAFRRRFQFIEYMPDAGVLKDTFAGDLHLGKFLQALNSVLLKYVGREKQIGHAFLMDGQQPIDDVDTFAAVFRYEILPMLQEYFHGRFDELSSILGKKLADPTTESFNEFLLDDPFELTGYLSKQLTA